MRGFVIGVLLAVGCGGGADEDGDGFPISDGDCDDLDAEIAPGMDELCDEVDNDCDGNIDNDPVDGETFYRDQDGDGFGVDGDTTFGCEEPEGYVDDGGDCDDDNDRVNPNADDTATRDRNCDGELAPPDETDETNGGAEVITFASMDCEGNAVEFSVELQAPIAGGWLFMQQTGVPAPQWCEEHPLEPLTPEIFELLLEAGIEPGDWEPGVSTAFSCPDLDLDPPLVTYAIMVTDASGNLADCIGMGHDLQGLAAGSYGCVNGTPSFELGLCTAGVLAR